MNLIVNFDQPQSSLPAGFVSDVDYVVNYYDQTFTANVTVTIDVGYGELDGQPIAAEDLGESEQINVSQVNYSAVVDALIAENAPGAATLPASPPAGNPGTLYMATAEQKALGLLPSNDNLDGYIGFADAPNLFSYTIGSAPPANEYYFVGVVEHEISEVMGRTSYLNYPGAYSLMDLFRYAGADARQFTTGAPSYFSIDGGVTDLNNWNNFQTGNGGDLGDWAPSAGNDAYDDNSNPGIVNSVTPTDLTLMAAIGWQQSGSAALKFVGTGTFSYSIVADNIWQFGGDLEVVSASQGGLSTTTVPNAEMGSDWNAIGIAPFEGPNAPEGVLWSNGTGGQVAVWLMDGAKLTVAAVTAGQMGSNWGVVATGEFSGDGNANVLWRENTGQVASWAIDGTSLASFGFVDGAIGTEWSVAATGDFFQAGRSALLWESTSGYLQDWLLNGTNIVAINAIGQMGAGWEVGGVGNFDGLSGGSQTSDIVWVNTETNQVQIWKMVGGQLAESVTPDGQDGLGWQLEGVGDYTGSGYSEMLWTDGTGSAQLWQLDGTHVTVVPTSGSSNTPELGGNSPSLTYGDIQNLQYVSAGQTVTNPVINDGTLQLASDAIVIGPITFAAGSAGTLIDEDQALLPDTVIGFDEGSDYLSFSGQSATTEASVIASAQTTNGNTLLTFPDQTSLVLVGVTHVDTGIFS